MPVTIFGIAMDLLLVVPIALVVIIGTISFVRSEIKDNKRAKDYPSANDFL